MPMMSAPLSSSSPSIFVAKLFLVLCVVGGGRITASSDVSLDSVRKSLIRQEDTIIFGLIERAKFPINSALYNKSSPRFSNLGFSGSLFDYFVRQSEALQSKSNRLKAFLNRKLSAYGGKVGRYLSPEENPFFPDDLPPSLVPINTSVPFLHPSANSINVNKQIWEYYLEKLLWLFAKEGDDGNYATTAISDLQCLQALSRRIHYGNFVAEVKFRDAPDDYKQAILDQDKDGLMKLLTSQVVEEEVKKRVEKKTKEFAKEVSVNQTENVKENYKIDPSKVYHLYGDWVIPLTKKVEVEYLLRRLD